MYEEYWGLKEKPFENTPDPKFLYRSREHEEALMRLLYAVKERKGCAMLTGVFGCGKTVLGQALLDELDRDQYKIAFITNPQLSHVELLRTIATHLGGSGLPTKRSELLKDHILDSIGEILHNNYNDGKDTIVIVDEAHVIEDKLIFEELRLLLNFQLRDRFLLTLLLLGQPELNTKVESIKQLSQRVAISYHLEPLAPEEARSYILHRLEVAQGSKPIFSEEALKVAGEKSGGIPRRINQICDMSLFTGFGRRAELIDGKIVLEAVKGLKR